MTAKQRDELLIRIDERQQQMHKVQNDILAEAKKTNGRITNIEQWRNSQQTALRIGWKTVVAVAGLVSFVITILVSIYL